MPIETRNARAKCRTDKPHSLASLCGEANVKLYRKSKAGTQYKDFPGRTHYALGQDGWEEVANYALT